MKKIKITRGEFLNLWNTLKKVGSEQRNIKGAYAIAKNITHLKSEYDEIVGTRVVVPEYIKYEKERIKIARSTAILDGQGKPIIENNSFIPKDFDVFGEMIIALKEGHKKAIEEQTKLDKEYQDFLNEEIDVEAYPIIFKYLPTTLDANTLVILMPIIDGDELIKDEVFGN